MSEIHLMLDCETLSLESNASILSFACVSFNLVETDEYTSATYEVKIDLKDCAAKKLDINGDTVRWWLTQDTELMKRTLIPSLVGEDQDGVVMSLTDALNGFTAFVEGLKQTAGIRSYKVHLWANGPAQDCTWIRHAYRACNLECPVPFYNDRDLRTIMHLASLKSQRRLHEEIKFEGEKHDAIADVKHQIKQVQMAWSILRSSEVNSRNV